MKKFRILILLLILLFSLVLFLHSSTIRDDREPYVADIYIINKVFQGTAELVIMTEDLEQIGCTAWAYEKVGDKYRFATDSHCVTDYIYDENLGGINVLRDNTYILILRAPNGKKSTHYTSLFAVDINKVIGDFAIIESEIDYDIELLSFSYRNPFVGQCVLNISYPITYLGNVFFGNIVSIRDDSVNPISRIFYANDDSMAIKFESIIDARGASGSAIVSCLDGKVISMLVSQNDGVVFATPISNFIKFKKEVDEKKRFVVQP